MKRKSWILVLLILVALTAALAAAKFLNSQDDWFVERPMPLIQADRLFDIGVVDANGDDWLDIYTSNHHFRQSLLIADGKGGYRDVLSEWGLDQSPEFPLAELSFTPPAVDKPGLYIYWLGTQFFIRAYKLSKPDDWQGSMRVNDPVDILKNEGFSVQKQDQATSVSETLIEFTPSSDGLLRMRPGGQGLPITFQFGDAVSADQIYVGRGKVSPRANHFALTMKDRHAMAWADYNGDGLLDVFIDRGALGGALRAYPEEIRSKLEDEFLVSKRKGVFADVASEVGLRKRDCSGRHARWLDFDGDGLIDLFVNCYDRENVEGVYPKQLYRQDNVGRLTDVSQELGAGLPDQQIGSFAWIDVDNDGDVDLVTFQDDGIYLYRNQEGNFHKETAVSRSLGGADKIGTDKSNIWLFDGKISVSDYDADGDLDLFSASRRGNLLLKNEAGKLVAMNLGEAGLPEKSATACWVDYDNDGLTDLYLFPQGLFRQLHDHRFEATKFLAFSNDDQYLASICNWADLDNDGRQDMLLALNTNPDYKRWWEFSRKRGRPEHWIVLAYRNVGATNHWLQIKLVGSPANRQGLNSQVTVATPSGRQIQEVGSTDGAFFSQGHYRLYFGLGKQNRADYVRVRWSDGQIEELRNVDVDKQLVIVHK